jgi:hypothetical protein
LAYPPFLMPCNHGFAAKPRCDDANACNAMTAHELNAGANRMRRCAGTHCHSKRRHKSPGSCRMLLGKASSGGTRHACGARFGRVGSEGQATCSSPSGSGWSLHLVSGGWAGLVLGRRRFSLPFFRGFALPSLVTGGGGHARLHFANRKSGVEHHRRATGE